MEQGRPAQDAGRPCGVATGTTVAQTGLIAFVGLAAPHLVRQVVKTTHGRLIVLASLMGAVLLTSTEILARGLMAPQELPVKKLAGGLVVGHFLMRCFVHGAWQRSQHFFQFSTDRRQYRHPAIKTSGRLGKPRVLQVAEKGLKSC